MILEKENLPTDLNGYVFNVILIDLDSMVGETICKNGDDSFTIFLNSRWSSEMQRKCFLHALDHVRNDDWSKENINQIEEQAHERW